MKLRDFLRNFRTHKIFLITTIFISILLTLSNFSSLKTFAFLSPMPPSEPLPATNLSGNTGGNILNFGTTVFDGTYLYYRRQSDGGNLYREKPDGSGLQKVSDSNTIFLNVSGDWIYYSGLRKFGGIFKTKKDGSGDIVKLSSDNPDSIHLYGQYIYYINSIPNTGERKLYKIKIDGSHLSEIKTADKSILGVSSTQLNVFDDWIYTIVYTNDGFGTHKSVLYRIKTDGSSSQKILDSYPDSFFVDNGWIYYTNASGLSKIKSDGTDNTLIVSSPFRGYLYSINSENDFLYYTIKSGEDAGVYRIRKDGSNMQRLKNGPARHLTVSADWIYFDDGNKYYRMKTDGTQLTVSP